MTSGDYSYSSHEEKIQMLPETLAIHIGQYFTNLRELLWISKKQITPM